MTIQEFKSNAKKQLQDSPSPDLDIQVILEHFLKLSKTQILLNKDKNLSELEIATLSEAIEKRKSGLPVAYITNCKEFFGYDFFVTPDVLIPKPDTEILVEKAIDFIYSKIEENPNKILTICDMCTGSGCIAISVFRTLIDTYKIPLSKMPKFTLVDISQKALSIAKKNAELLCTKDELYNLHFIQSNLFENIQYSYDVILTNPPYIPHSMVKELLQDGRNEPVLALDGDITLFGERAKTADGKEKDDGLEIIRNLIPQSKEHLSPRGIILMETGEYNAKETSQIAKTYDFKTEIFTDLEDQLRVVVMENSKTTL
jgi:release factor glutamine methyltransferase